MMWSRVCFRLSPGNEKGKFVFTAILKRVLFVVLGYFAGTAAGTLTFPLTLTAFSLFEPSSRVWDWLGLGPVAIMVAPIIAVMFFLTLVVVTFAQAIVAHVLTEFFAVRSIWVHLAIAVAIGLSAVAFLLPGWYSEMSLNQWLVTLAALVAALAGGAVYWAIAGRNAGLRADGAT